jgi:hypothetical protein
MSNQFVKRLADEILETYGSDGDFEIDFMDKPASDAMALELQRRGCIVTPLPFRSAIHVVCPPSVIEPRQMEKSDLLPSVHGKPRD